jgi:hypothetical protein
MSFKSVQAGIAKRQGISSERAGAILAAGSRNASAAAKRKNPKLKKVMGGNMELPENSMKRRDLLQGRNSNLSHKCAFRQGCDY